ncbi:hypothetical protein NC661_19890 [Aquibacillus koreensis]|uniref:Tetratricopeptide SHNi-TPR domain-containing protein n=1 Tax=Aquibacillus koreensis TaxID=279446 RepID=A0A9X4ALM1_9BACI|nr:hypothetical protein [Aquibacillus koreensis]MCT2536665.1 hypothetical protein [Aquibacillus koreensis]MDC3422618.1 hypothetical protein [Aquibacillus koreensis]
MDYEQNHDHYLIPYLEGENIESLNSELRCAIYYYFGYYYYDKSQFDQCLEHFYKVKSFVNNLEIKASVIYNISIIHKRMGHYQDAILTTKEAIEYLKKIDNTYLLTLSLNSLGDLYREKKLNKEATVALESAKQIAEQYSHVAPLGYIFHNLGLISMEKSNFEDASSYFYKALHIKQKNTNSDVLITYRLLIDCKLKEEDIEEAAKLYKIASELTDTKDDQNVLLFHFIDYFYINNELVLFEKNLNQLALFFEGKKSYDYLTRCYKKLAKYYYNTRKYKRSSYFYNKTLELLERSF